MGAPNEKGTPAAYGVLRYEASQADPLPGLMVQVCAQRRSLTEDAPRTGLVCTASVLPRCALCALPQQRDASLAPAATAHGACLCAVHARPSAAG